MAGNISFVSINRSTPQPNKYFYVMLTSANGGSQISSQANVVQVIGVWVCGCVGVWGVWSGVWYVWSGLWYVWSGVWYVWGVGAHGVCGVQCVVW